MDAQTLRPATGAHTTNGRPNGSTALTPHLVVTPAEKALSFYQEVLGARLLDVTRFPGSSLVAHAELDFGLGMLTLSDPMAAYGLVAPRDPAGGATFSLALYVPNVDDVVTRAVAAGDSSVAEDLSFVETGPRRHLETTGHGNANVATHRVGR